MIGESDFTHYIPNEHFGFYHSKGYKILSLEQIYESTFEYWDLLLYGIYTIFGIYHIYFYFIRRKDLYYLYFGLFSFFLRFIFFFFQFDLSKIRKSKSGTRQFSFF